MEPVDIFAEATRRQFRYESHKGALSVEHLWELPLNDTLDDVARRCKQELDATPQHSFITRENESDETQTVAKLKFDVVEYIINYKLKIEEKAKSRAENARKRQDILRALDDRDKKSLASKTKKQLKEELAKLDSAL